MNRGANSCMQVESVEAIPLKRDLGKRFANAQKWRSSREYCLVRITADDGTVGWGECWGPIAGNRELLEETVGPWLKGKDPRNVETIHDELKYILTTKFHSFCPASVISGVDIALWDLYGKAVGEPISRLIGGRVRDDVRAYATGHFWPPVDDFEELRAEIDVPFVVVLDEADYLGEAGCLALYDLYDTPGISVVLIVNGRTHFSAISRTSQMRHRRSKTRSC